MATVARLAQLEHGAAGDHFTSVLQEDADQVFQIAQAWLAVDQRHHVHAEGVLQLRLLVQVVEDHLGHFAALELDHEAHAGLVRFVLDVADALDFLLMHQFGHALLQRLLVDLVGQLVHDDGLSLAAVNVFKVAFGAHDHAPPSGAVTVLDAVDPVDDAGRGEVRCRDDLHQLIDGGIWVVQQVQAGVHHFVQVVWRDIGGHAHGDARRSIDQQIGQLAGQHDRALSSCRRSSGTKSTVSLSMSASISWAILSKRISVYRMAAALSPSTDPKLPWPSISG